MQARALPPANYLRECLHYSVQTGLFAWKHRPVIHFISERCSKIWNSNYAATPAFITRRVNGYLTSGLDRRTLLAHRVAWKYVTGEEPPAAIDHIDQDKTNNRWANLRAVTKSQNAVNNIERRNRTGFTGVQQMSENCFATCVWLEGKRFYVGAFDSPEKAYAARMDVLRKHHGAYLCEQH